MDVADHLRLRRMSSSTDPMARGCPNAAFSTICDRLFDVGIRVLRASPYVVAHFLRPYVSAGAPSSDLSTYLSTVRLLINLFALKNFDIIEVNAGSDFVSKLSR